MSAQNQLVDEIAAAVVAKLAGKLPGATEDKRLFTTDEAAKYLGCSLPHLKAMIGHGKIPTVRLSVDESAIRFKNFIDKHDLDTLIEANKQA
jgi:excisionase family DNA binding protein